MINMKAFILLFLLHSAVAFTQFVWKPKKGKDPGSDFYRKQGTCTCLKTIQKLNKLQMYFNSSLTELQEEYSKTKDKYESIKTERTALSVALYESDTFRCFGPHSTTKTIVYEKVFFNMGDSYNSSTGVFTAPCSGVYSLAFTVYSDAGSPGGDLKACAILQVNGEDMVGSTDQNAYDQEDSSSTVMVAFLKRNDSVSVSLPKDCFLCDDMYHYNTFNVFLLFAADHDSEIY